MNITIKKLYPEDLDLTRQFLIYWQTEDSIINPSIPDDSYLLDLLNKDTFHILVALDATTLVGGITAYELPMYLEQVSEMFLYEIGVDENYRKLGIATQLIDALKNICIEKGIKTMFVGTSSDNRAAQQLYIATGGEMEEIPWFTYQLS